MEKAPATRPASPASSTTDGTGFAPATPRISEILVSRPSLIPKTAARAAPPWRSRWWDRSCGWRRCSPVSPTGATLCAMETVCRRCELQRPPRHRVFRDLEEEVMQGARRDGEDRDDVHHLDHGVDRGAGGVLVRIADGVTGDRRGMRVGPLATEVALFDVLLGVVPRPAARGHLERHEEA